MVSRRASNPPLAGESPSRGPETTAGCGDLSVDLAALLCETGQNGCRFRISRQNSRWAAMSWNGGSGRQFVLSQHPQVYRVAHFSLAQ
jgi:hypothetical protein